MILHAGFDLITACGRDPDATVSRFGRCAATAEHLVEVRSGRNRYGLT